MDKKMVLFVDDELNPEKNVSNKYREILYKMAESLEDFCEVVQVYSMNSALEKIRYQRFDAAVVDILIPISDNDIYSKGKKDIGIQLIKELMENNIPVLSISNRADRYTASILGSEYGVTTLDKKLSEIPRLISLVRELKPNRRRRYCSFRPKKNEICREEFEPKGPESAFVISSTEYKKDAQKFSNRLLSKGFQVDFWVKDPNASARMIFCNKTCPRIYGNKSLAANISDLNCNVFFEIGFAYGIGRLVFLMYKNDKEKEPSLKILKTISWKGYKQVEEVLESFAGTIGSNKKILNSNKTYAIPEMFKHIHEFDKPEKREREGKYLVAFDNSVINKHQEIFREKGITRYIIPFNLSKFSNPIIVANKLLSAKCIIFFPQGDMKNSFSDYRINNAELMFFAGLCVAQGVPVRIITDSRSPDFSEIS